MAALEKRAMQEQLLAVRTTDDINWRSIPPSNFLIAIKNRDGLI